MPCSYWCEGEENVHLKTHAPQGAWVKNPSEDPHSIRGMGKNSYRREKVRFRKQITINVDIISNIKILTDITSNHFRMGDLGLLDMDLYMLSSHAIWS